MALTRKSLKAMGLTEEQVDSIVEMHTEVKDELKKQLAEATEKADQYDALKQELDDLKSKAEDGFKEKYEEEHRAFEDYKKEQADKAEYAKKREAFEKACEDVGIASNRVKAVSRIAGDTISGITFDKDGKQEDVEGLKEAIKAEYGEYIVTTSQVGANTATPPANGGSGKTKDEIMAIKNPVERQKAIAENLDLFYTKKE